MRRGWAACSIAARFTGAAARFRPIGGDADTLRIATTLAPAWLRERRLAGSVATNLVSAAGSAAPATMHRIIPKIGRGEANACATDIRLRAPNTARTAITRVTLVFLLDVNTVTTARAFRGCARTNSHLACAGAAATRQLVIARLTWERADTGTNVRFRQKLAPRWAAANSIQAERVRFAATIKIACAFPTRTATNQRRYLHTETVLACEATAAVGVDPAGKPIAHARTRTILVACSVVLDQPTRATAHPVEANVS